MKLPVLDRLLVLSGWINTLSVAWLAYAWFTRDAATLRVALLVFLASLAFTFTLAGFARKRLRAPQPSRTTHHKRTPRE